MRKLSWFAALAALMLCGLAPVVAGCGDDDDDTGDGDADSDGDTDTDADTDGDADCTSGDPMANDGCDWTCNDMAAPDLRLTALHLSAPAALDNLLLAGVITTALDGGDFVWLVDNEGGMNFRTGSGLCDDALEMCSFEGGDYPPAEGMMDYDQGTGAFRVPNGTGTLDVDVVIHTDAAGDIVLNLKEASISGTVTHEGNCVGDRLNEVTPSRWTPNGDVAAKITVDDAKVARITEGLPPQSLCDFLASGGSGGDGYCDDNPDSATWENPPDTVVGEDPAWGLAGEFAALGVMIH